VQNLHVFGEWFLERFCEFARYFDIFLMAGGAATFLREGWQWLAIGGNDRLIVDPSTLRFDATS